LVVLALPAIATANPPTKFLDAHCHACHDANTKSGGLDLTALKFTPSDADNFAIWVKVHDRIAAGEMPPKNKPRPPAADTTAVTKWLHDELVGAERKTATDGKTRLRRMTRGEYENTIRDLFDLPGLLLQNDLPADGQVHGFDKNADALDLSHVNLAKYLEAADRVLDMAIATRPRAPAPIKQRISLANPHGFVAHVLMNGDGVLLKNKKPDPDFPPAGEHGHIDQGAHERMGSFRNGASVGLFRHEDESFHPYFNEFVAIYPGRYRLTTSLWSFQWDKGAVLPSRGTEAARLSIVQLVGDGRGGGHPSTVIGYYDAPSMAEQTHTVNTWLNPRETIGFNTASLAPAANYYKKKRAMEFTGPAITCDFLDVEGPFHEAWPPLSHRRLFGELPIALFDAKPGVRPPSRQPDRQQLFMGKNKPDPIPGVWTVASAKPLEDADKLLTDFLPRAFRRLVSADVRKQYVARVAERLKAGDCFEVAMRWAYRAALCSPDFLYHVEPAGELDDFALACRLSYFLWHSMPDDKLTKLATANDLRKPEVLRGEVERLLADAKSQRFVEDFLGQWLKLRQIAANDADRKLYPEFSKYLQDSMVAETHAYFRELIDKNLTADRLVKSDFAMLNEKLAVHYGVPGVSGSQIRRVQLPAGSPRGGFLTQASILKITANGTTTSPVPRGAFVLDRLLGRPPAPPPPNVPAVEPDVRGAVTIREQLAKHRDNAACAACHAKIDPPGFALEEFDVIGGQRSRYRSLGAGDPAPRGAIDPFIGIAFKLGPKVDASGQLSDGRKFGGITEFQTLLAADRDALLANLARQFAVYSTGRGVSFADRDEIAAVVGATNKNGGGIRTLIHELVQSPLFKSSKGFTAGERVTYRVTGLFSRDREKDLRAAFEEITDIKLVSVNFDDAEVTLEFLPAKLFPGQKPERVTELVSDKLAQASNHTLRLKPRRTIARDKLTTVEIAAGGLDCKACCLAAYEAVAAVEGVYQATASFKEGKVTALIDATKTTREQLEDALRKKGVAIGKR
jgi:mono/diheme cytochrome c family protein/copper chaperone CopZ